MAGSSIAPIALPRLDHPDRALCEWADQVLRILTLEFQRINTPAGSTAYTLTSATPARALNPTTATLPQLAQVVAALITDGKTKGTIA